MLQPLEGDAPAGGGQILPAELFPYPPHPVEPGAGTNLVEAVEAALGAPDDRVTLLRLAEVLAGLGRDEDADRVLRRAARLHPIDPEVRLVLDAAASRREPSAAGEFTAAFSAAFPANPLAAAAPPARLLLVPAERSSRGGSTMRWRARVMGFAAVAPALATYVIVGLRVHVVVGLAAAMVVALTLTAAGSLPFPDRREALAEGIRGVGAGVAAIFLAGLVSLAIALGRAIG